MARSAQALSVSPFGELLRRWRVARRLSQLALAVEAEISSRHLSFIETGRAKPSREMVALLANVLDVPLRDRNALLLAAGYAPAYAETPLAAPELEHVRRALDFILAQQEPYPAIVVDGGWDLVMANAAATRLLGLFLEDLADRPPPLNVLRLTFDPYGLRPFIANWETLAGHLIERVHRDPGAGALVEELLAYPAVPRRWRTPDPAAQSVPLVLLELGKGDLVTRFFSTIATLGTPQDITLQELRIESFFPADEATEAVIRRLADAQPTL